MFSKLLKIQFFALEVLTATPQEEEKELFRKEQLTGRLEGVHTPSEQLQGRQNLVYALKTLT